MKLRLEGHDFKNACENAVIAFFPYEPAEFVAEGGDVLIRRAGRDCTAVFSDGTYGSARPTDDSERELRHAVQLAFYRALKKKTGHKPAWGALTGVRPALMAAQCRSPHDMTVRYDVSPPKARAAFKVLRYAEITRATLSPRDFGLYAGIPFCPSKCGYCSFVSSDMANSGKLAEPYAEVLESELAALNALARRIGLNAVCVYVGGGTPTALRDETLERVLRAVSAFDLSRCLEFTVEAGRPDTFTPENMRMIRSFGANRISVNPQSLNPNALRAMGREHSPEDFFRAYELAKSAGFPAINADVIAGLPGDDFDGFRDTLERVLALKPENVTVHALCIKRGSKLFGEGTDNTLAEKCSDFSRKRLDKSGFLPYYLYRQKRAAGGLENVGYSLPGVESLYNIGMMGDFLPVLAAGAGAVTKLVPPDGPVRLFNMKYPAEYISAADKIGGNLKTIEEFYERHLQV